MKLRLSALALFALATIADASSPCLRVMPTSELVGNSLLVVRGHVIDLEKSDYGMNRRDATLAVDDVVVGDTTISSVHVGTESRVACAEDRFDKKEEVLVFLSRDGGLYQTVNFQFGRFRVENGLVRDWRMSDGSIGDRPFADVRREIESYAGTVNTPAISPAPTGNAPAPPEAAEVPGAATPVAPAGAIPGRKAGKPLKKEIYNRPQG